MVTFSYILCVCCDFIHIWYSNQIPCVADACKIPFGSMPNLSNYGNIFLKCYMFVAIPQIRMVDFVHIGYSTQPWKGHDAYKIYFDSVLNCSIYVNYCIHLYVCSDISEKNQWILFMLGTVINQHRGFMHIHILWLCDNIAQWANHIKLTSNLCQKLTSTDHQL